MGRNLLLSVTAGLLAATLSIALPNVRIEIPGAEGQAVSEPR